MFAMSGLCLFRDRASVSALRCDDFLERRERVRDGSLPKVTDRPYRRGAHRKSRLEHIAQRLGLAIGERPAPSLCLRSKNPRNKRPFQRRRIRSKPSPLFASKSVRGKAVLYFTCLSAKLERMLATPLVVESFPTMNFCTATKSVTTTRRR